MPRRLRHFVPLVLALQRYEALAFSSITSRTKIRSSNTNTCNPVHLRWDHALASVESNDDGLSSTDTLTGDTATHSRQSSHIVSIKSSNIAGMINDNDDDGGGSNTDIQVDFGTDACLVVVTGESGSGKSLLVSKAIDLIAGGKAISSLVPAANGEGSESSSVEMTVNLQEPQLSSVSSTLQRFNIDPSILYNNVQDSTLAQLHLKRALSSTDSGRLKSVCRINDKHISLKTFRQISAPLFTRVDVGIASAALGRMASRLAMIDIGVPGNLKRNCATTRDMYKDAKKCTEKIKHDLDSRVLPSSLQGGSNNGEGLDEEQVKLLEHWIDELDSFETRINRFQESVSSQYNEMVSSGEFNAKGGSSIAKILHKLKKATWVDMQQNDSDLDHDSLFSALLDFREGMQEVERQLVSTQSAYESLASLSAPNSALVALENTRKMLYSISSDESGPLFDSIEKTHELLNNVETSLDLCARSIGSSSDSLMSTLEKMVFAGVPIEEVDSIIADWNALARKHGISPYSLPNCHMSISEELDGNVQALKLLPEAEENERMALEDYSYACKELSEARVEAASGLSQSVTLLLPSLGLEGSGFRVQLSQRSGGFEEPYVGSESVGVDIADFLLLHQKTNGGNSIEVGTLSEDETQHGGNIEQVGSSGEKSRILLAIETALPGSIGSACNSFTNSAENIFDDSDSTTLPISVVYDEIDAHVGGRAAVTMARLLSNQSRKQQSSDSNCTVRSSSQIIAITHSASLAAIADHHIVVERVGNNRLSSLPIRTYVVDGSSRRREIARMASGDLASGEAETFADALIRDALLEKEMSSP